MSEAPNFKEFAEQVELRRAGDLVREDSTTISDGKSKLKVRLAGGYITEATLSDMGRLVPVLYCGPDASLAKLDASHDMSPAGASEDVGGQHGIYRWANFDVARIGPRHMELKAAVPDKFLGMRKHFQIEKSSLTIATTLSNSTDMGADTSLGHHLYWKMDPNAENRPAVLSSTGTSPMADTEVYEAVMDGDSRYWSGFDGAATVVLPGIGRFSLQSEAKVIEADGTILPQPLGMLLWHRPKTDSVCFEPVVGNENDADQLIRPSSEVPNRQLYLAAGATVTLKTTISALGAANQA